MKTLTIMRLVLIVALLAGALLLVGCEEMADGSKGEGPGSQVPGAHALNPPSWIHGTWGYCESSPIEFYWKFSEHNIELRSGTTVTDYREQATTPGVTVTEDEGQDWYRLALQGSGGIAISSNRFVRDGSRLRWTASTRGTSTTLTICKI
jgi:hypothetical protein